MEVLNMLMPIVILFGIGKLCKIKNIVNVNAVSGMKTLITTICLPVLVFNTMSNATYGFSSFVLIISCILTNLLLFFGSRYLGKALDIFGDFKDITPYMVMCFECGMMGYTLVGTLVGNDNLVPVATMDVVVCFFSFGLVVNGLSMITGRKKEHSMIYSLAHVPTFVAVVVGTICGVLKVGQMILDSPLGTIYSNSVSYLTAPITPIILICIGYDINFSITTFKKICRPFIFREACCTIGLLLTLFLYNNFVGLSKMIVITLIMFFALPGTFLPAVYLKEEKQSEYASAFVSVCILFSLIVFGILCVVSR